MPYYFVLVKTHIVFHCVKSEVNLAQYSIPKKPEKVLLAGCMFSILKISGHNTNKIRYSQ